MAITTDNDKLAVMEMDSMFEPGLPLSPGVLSVADQQQLIWGYPGVLWEESVGGDVISKQSPFMVSIGRMMNR